MPILNSINFGIYFISFLLTGLFIAYFLVSYEVRREIIKFIGALIVIFIALFSNNGFAYVGAVLISGLIIASERFMSLIIAAFSRNKDFWMSDNFRYMIDKLSGKEKDSKVRDEVVETEAAEKIASSGMEKEEKLSLSTKKTRRQKIHKGKKIAETPSTSSQNIPPKFEKLTYQSLLPKLEIGTLRYIFRYMNGFSKLNENVRVGSHVFDGFATNKHGRPYFFEVKVFPNITNPKGEIMAQQVVVRLQLWLPSVISYFDTLPESEECNKPVLLVSLAINAFGDLSGVKEKIKQFKLQQLSKNVILKFQYLNLPELMKKGAFVSSSDLNL